MKTKQFFIISHFVFNTVNVQGRICNRFCGYMICVRRNCTVCIAHSCTVVCSLHNHTMLLLLCRRNIQHRLSSLIHPYRLPMGLHPLSRNNRQRPSPILSWEMFHHLLLQTILDPHTLHSFVGACRWVSYFCFMILVT